MKLTDLYNGQEVRYRFGFAGRNSVDWNDWATGHLYLVRRALDLPIKFRRGVRGWRKGDILTLVIENADHCPDYREDDYCENGVFLVEDCYLEIKDLT